VDSFGRENTIIADSATSRSLIAEQIAGAMISLRRLESSLPTEDFKIQSPNG
jgi:hypothetical protein